MVTEEEHNCQILRYADFMIDGESSKQYYMIKQEHILFDDYYLDMIEDQLIFVIDQCLREIELEGT